MFEKLQLKLILILAALILQTTIGAQSLPPAVRWIPQNAVISLELSDTKALLDLFVGEKAIEFITSLPIYQKQSSNPKFREFLGIVRYLEATLGADWRTALAKLTGGGITFAICPKDTVILIIDAKDEQMLNRLHETFLNIAKDEARKQNQPDLVTSKQYQDITAWTFDGKEAHAIIGKRVVLSNRSEGLNDAAAVVLSHHEKMDGSGYPKGLKGKESPVTARIFAIADVFDALTSKRPYKEPMSFEEAMDIA